VDFGLFFRVVGGDLFFVARGAVWVARRKAIWSFRLRLHSGLRQQGRPLAEAMSPRRPEAKASGYQPWGT
jgi:hypothetical protein